MAYAAAPGANDDNDDIHHYHQHRRRRPGAGGAQETNAFSSVCVVCVRGPSGAAADKQEVGIVGHRRASERACMPRRAAPRKLVCVRAWGSVTLGAQGEGGERKRGRERKRGEGEAESVQRERLATDTAAHTRPRWHPFPFFLASRVVLLACLLAFCVSRLLCLCFCIPVAPDTTHTTTSVAATTTSTTTLLTQHQPASESGEDRVAGFDAFLWSQRLRSLPPRQDSSRPLCHSPTRRRQPSREDRRIVRCFRLAASHQRCGGSPSQVSFSFHCLGKTAATHLSPSQEREERKDVGQEGPAPRRWGRNVCADD